MEAPGLIGVNGLRVALASNNKGKLKEFAELLEGTGIELVSAQERIEVEENGSSFLSNAMIKAREWSMRTGLTALADDSGITVRALDWRPGIFSARIVEGSDADRNEWLLRSLEANADGDRYAEYVAAIALCSVNEGWTVETEARCGGNIADAPRGVNGFGYDPIFIPSGYTQTLGELDGGIKAKISHRSLALGHLLKIIKK